MLRSMGTAPNATEGASPTLAGGAEGATAKGGAKGGATGGGATRVKRSGRAAARVASADVVSYGSAIAACERSRAWRPALSLLEEMRSEDTKARPHATASSS